MQSAADQMALATLLQKALGHLQARRLDEADHALGQAARLAPGHSDVLQLQGMAARYRGDLVRAAELLRTSLKIAPGQPAVWNNLGNVLKDQGAADEAVAAYGEALKLQPAYVEAAANLASAERARGRPGEAASAARRVLAMAPGQATATQTLALALLDLGRAQEALGVIRPLAERPGAGSLTFAVLGNTLRTLADRAGALQAYARALALDPKNADAENGIGNVHWDGEEFEPALAAYRRAVEIKPDHGEAHRSLTRLLWSLGRKGELFSALRAAWARAPGAARLKVIEAETHQMLDDPGAALVALGEAVRLAPSNAQIEAKLAGALARHGRFEEAERAFASALARRPGDPAILMDAAEAFMWNDRYEEALAAARKAQERSPLDQRAIALEAWAMRALGQIGAERLNDYKRFLDAGFIDLPEGYADFAAFNTALERDLLPLHKTKEHPIEQTLRNGTQTLGHLFPRPEASLTALEAAIRARVMAYVAALPSDPSHPHLKRKSLALRFSGSWSVRLRSGGFHTDHVHPAGWISGCYYVTMPSVVAGSNRQEGWIKFGDAGRTRTRHFTFEEIVEPKPGLLVLFPSYFWHGTVPFESDEFRTTVAFDIVPA